MQNEVSLLFIILNAKICLPAYIQLKRHKSFCNKYLHGMKDVGVESIYTNKPSLLLSMWVLSSYVFTDVKNRFCGNVPDQNLRFVHIEAGEQH